LSGTSSIKVGRSLLATLTDLAIGLCGYTRAKLMNDYIYPIPKYRHPLSELLQFVDVYEPPTGLSQLASECLPIPEGNTSKLELKLHRMRLERVRLKYATNERLCERVVEERRKGGAGYPVDGHHRFEEDLNAIGEVYYSDMAALVLQQCEVLQSEMGESSLYGAVLDWMKERQVVRRSALPQRKSNCNCSRSGSNAHCKTP
jgi:hypothetical protein